MEFLKGCDVDSFPVGFDRDLLYPPVVNVIPYNADAATANTTQKNNDDKSRNNNGNVNRNNVNAIANEITTSSMLMSTTASSTSPCHKKRKLSSNPNNNNTNVVVTTPFDSSLSTSYDGIINPLNTTLSQQQHILFLPMQ